MLSEAKDVLWFFADAGRNVCGARINVSHRHHNNFKGGRIYEEVSGHA